MSARFSVSRRWLGYISLAVVFAVGCVLLSNWQFVRRNEAATQITRVNSNFDAPVVAIGTLVPSASSFDENATWRPVRVRGTYRASDQVLVRNRVRDSDAGFELLVPLALTTGGFIIVDRGWLPATDSGASPTSTPVPPTGVVDVIGRLRASESAIAGQSNSAGTVPTITVEKLLAQWNASGYSAAYLDLVSESPSSAHGLLAQKPELTEGNHLSYAFQWIAFGVLGFVAVGWIIRREMQIARGENKPRTRRRRDQDSEAEDALVNAQL